MKTMADLEAGREALGQFAWADAFRLLRPLRDSDVLTPEDLEGLAEAAWWHAELDICIGCRERAYSAYLNKGNRRRAGLVALNLAKDNFGMSRSTVGKAWLSRARNLLEGEEGSVELGHLHRVLAVIEFEGNGDYDKAIEHADTSYAIGEAAHDRDLMALALHDKGRALIARGQVDEGMRLMDEALVAAVSGELLPFTTGVVYCNMITICEDLADMARASEWTDAAKRWCDRMAIAGFPGMCRVHRASIVRRRGAWDEAARESEKAAEELKFFNQAYTGEAFYNLGEVRFDLGDVEGAEAAFRHAHSLGRDPQPGLSLLQLATGQTAAARAGIQRALDDEHRDLQRAKFLPAATEIFIADGDVDAARTAATELNAIAGTYGTPALQAEAATARGRIELESGDPRAAATSLRAALKVWRTLEAPYETAKLHLLLGRAYAGQGDAGAVSLEMETARQILTKLGAARDLAALDGALPAASAQPAGDDAAFVREGEYWSIAYGGRSFKLRDSKGLHYIRRLLATPRVEIHVLDLVAAPSGAAPANTEPGLEIGGSDAGGILDDAAKNAYRARLRQLQEELDEAESWGDEGNIDRARSEIEFLTHELAAAVGLGGRDRKAASVAERARVNVTRTIRSALDRISEQDPELGEHLARTIRTGTYCSYEADPRVVNSWRL